MLLCNLRRWFLQPECESGHAADTQSDQCVGVFVSKQMNYKKTDGNGFSRVGNIVTFFPKLYQEVYCIAAYTEEQSADPYSVYVPEGAGSSSWPRKLLLPPTFLG
jgi:hypothetical protein